MIVNTDSYYRFGKLFIMHENFFVVHENHTTHHAWKVKEYEL